VIRLPVDPGLVCLRGLSPQRLRFEVEYGLERGTTANSFLFAAGPDGQGRPMPPVLVHPHGASFAAPCKARVPRGILVDIGAASPDRCGAHQARRHRWPS
jgi:hypothetical protein